jgi:hypothetical protein
VLNKMSNLKKIKCKKDSLGNDFIGYTTERTNHRENPDKQSDDDQINNARKSDS